MNEIESLKHEVWSELTKKGKQAAAMQSGAVIEAILDLGAVIVIPNKGEEA
jgi:hypothetical protein